MSRPESGPGDRGQNFPELIDVMRRLLGPDGCPWDRKQTLDSLKPYLLEEAYEVLDAIDHGTPEQHCDELGDLLMQIAFHCEIRRAEGAFVADDAIRAIVDKLIRRHPHVFGDASADTPDKVTAQWSRIKEEERKQRSGDAPVPARTLAGVPAAMPALSRAQQLTARAAQVGFDWPDAASCREKVSEETEELDRAIAEGDADAIRDELGDLLFAVVNLARKLGCDAEDCLRGTNRRFVDRFEYIEDRLAQRGLGPRQASLEEMDGLWNEAKRRGS
jgi:MazG family protein